MRLDATRRKPARQPEAVAAGFESQRNPRNIAAGFDRLIPPAMQHRKQPFWAGLQLLARLTLNTERESRSSFRRCDQVRGARRKGSRDRNGSKAWRLAA